MSREWLLWLSSRVADAMIEALDDRWPSSIAVDRSFLLSCGIATVRYAAVPTRSPAHMAAARGEDDAKCCRQRCERVPPGSPKGVAGEGAPVRAGLKWCSKFRPSDLKRNVTPDAPRCRCWPTRAVEAGGIRTANRIASPRSLTVGSPRCGNRWYPTRLDHVLLVGFSSQTHGLVSQ
jgi:hypothetical protein